MPDTMRSMVMRPAKGSAIVFQTNAAYGAVSEALVVVSAPSLPIVRKSRSAGEGA